MKYSIEGSTLTGIADEIRAKINSVTKIPVTEMKAKIGGLADTSDATATVYDIPVGKIAYGKNGKITGAGLFKLESSADAVVAPLPFDGCNKIFYTGSQFVAQSDERTAFSNNGLKWTEYSGTRPQVVVDAGLNVLFSGGKADKAVNEAL